MATRMRRSCPASANCPRLSCAVIQPGNPERSAFNRTEAFLALKDKRDLKTSEALAPAFRLLVYHNYLRPLDRPENVRPGPIPEVYAVNLEWERDSP